MSHFADDETLALIAKLQAIVQEQAREIESLQTSLTLVKNSITWRGNKIADSQHKVKVLTDALQEIAKDATSQYEDAWCGAIAAEALAAVKGE